MAVIYVNRLDVGQSLMFTRHWKEILQKILERNKNLYIIYTYLLKSQIRIFTSEFNLSESKKGSSVKKSVNYKSNT